MEDVNPGLLAVDLIAAGLSTAREKVLEHRLLSDLAIVMLKRGTALDILRSEVDAQGHDVVLEAAGTIRHLQLKASVDGGKRRAVDINVKLRAKPSGCVVWMSYDPSSLMISSYRWLGAEPGETLPDLGGAVTKYAKANSAGAKLQRPSLRNVPKTKFELLPNLEALADRLFGPTRSTGTSLIIAQLRRRFGEAWVAKLDEAKRITSFDDSIEFAHLIDGYAVLEQLGVLDPPEWLEREASKARAGQFNDDLGSGLIDHSQKMTVAAIQMADMKVWAHRS